MIRGKPEALELLLVGVLSGGHVLVEDVPGVGKTTLAKALSRLFSMEFSRIQFTPDLLPADVLGSQVLNPKDGSFSFQPGPVFTSVLLADEINRASPRTQSALLEAMNEDQVTVDGITRPLPRPFFVIATQNPVDFQGTYPLPEAQLDRFVLRLDIGYPQLEDELQILLDRRRTDPVDQVEPVATADDLVDLQTACRDITVRDLVSRYLLEVVHATRSHKDLELGVSPRGSLSLYRATQARALLQGRDYVSPEDIQRLAVPVLAHRVIPTQRARFGGTDSRSLIREMLEGIQVPT